MEATPWTAPEGARRDRGRVGTRRGGSRSCRLLPRLPRVNGLAQSEQGSRPLQAMFSPASRGLRPAGRNGHLRSLPARRKKSPPESVGRFPRHTELHGDGVGGAKPDAANVAGQPIRVLDQQPSGFSSHKLIPALVDQNLWAQSRSPMDMILHGWSTSLFHASQQWSTISS